MVKTDALVEELALTVDRALEELALREENIRLRRELLRVFAAQNIVGHSRPIESILEMVRTVAPTTSTVLITGESGTGKELVARAIHEASLRREKPFISINCGAFPETLLESELFGYLKGSFTGAETNRKGIIEVGPRRHAVSRRNRRNQPGHASQIAASSSGKKCAPLGGSTMFRWTCG